MEKIKDFLYDISDIVISILIIAVIFVVISWKLNDTITLKKPVLTETTPVENKVVEIDLGDDNNVGEDISSSTDKPIGEDTTDTPSAEDSAPVEEETVVESPVDTSPARDVLFEIPKGAIGYNIAKSLEENGLITDRNAFLKEIEDMGVGNKLNAGTFKLNTNMDSTTIIKILAGIN